MPKVAKITVEDLVYLKKLISKMSKLVIKKNVDHFVQYATDAAEGSLKTVAAKILSFKKAIEAKESPKKSEKVALAAAKLKEAFVKAAEKTDAKLVKAKEAEKKKAEKVKAALAAKKAKSAAKKAKKVKSKKATGEKKPRKPRAKKVKASPKKSASAFMWGGGFEEDGDSNMDF